MATQRLGLWMNGLRVGDWERQRNRSRLIYDPAWVQSPQGRPISLSLPFLPGNAAHAGDAVTAFFDNLLPDNERIRARLARRYRTASTEPFDLLTALGMDCVGALQLLPPDDAPSETLYGIQGQPLDEAGIAQQLRNATLDTPPGFNDPDDTDLRLSIAGAQEKTALLKHGTQWLLPQGSTPTTHIFKLPLGLVGNMQADMRTSVENEWLCACLAAAYGLPVAPCEIAQFEDQKVLIVERFDRQLASDGKWIQRLPQEDLCQATATPPHLKYQDHGGPGIARIMHILTGSIAAEEDCRNFFKTQILFWMLAATDGHAKNFSLFLQGSGHFKATPLYDVLSAHPIIGKGRNKLAPSKAKLAMAVRSKSNHYRIQEIQRRHWLAMAKHVALGTGVAEQIIDELLAQTNAVIEQVSGFLPAGFPADVAEAIFAGLKAQAARLALTTV
ncbi:MAG: type II toxin-antitoxin system HipA family toxin [Rhodocyclaceae bacterium]